MSILDEPPSPPFHPILDRLIDTVGGFFEAEELPGLVHTTGIEEKRIRVVIWVVSLIDGIHKYNTDPMVEEYRGHVTPEG